MNSLQRSGLAMMLLVILVTLPIPKEWTMVGRTIAMLVFLAGFAMLMSDRRA